MKTRVSGLRYLGVLLLAFGCGQGTDTSASATADTAKAGTSSTATAAATSTATATASVASTAAPEKTIEDTATAPAPTGTGDAAAGAAMQSKLDGVKKLAKNGVLPAGEADKVMKSGDQAKVALLNAGGEPRTELKYELKPSQKDTTIMKMDMTMKMELGAGAPAPPAMKLPQVEMALDMTTADKAESNGDMRLTGMVSNVKVSPGATAMEQQVGKAMGDALTGMKGMKISYVITPKGRTRDVKVDVPAGAPAQAQQMVEQTKQSFENLMAPLPDEAVGTGAQWVVVNRVSTGADILQWTTYTLKKKDGSRIELQADVTQLAASNTISGPQMPGTANIDSFASGGSGLTNMDLTRIAPDKGTADVKNAMAFSAQGQAMKIETQVNLQFSRK
ncbi:MAG: hypothetical protein HOW73_04245 [Polyangiaceae bacterium]|nr:hypothetical protein [Polyangiaceae bacterium]